MASEREKFFCGAIVEVRLSLSTLIIVALALYPRVHAEGLVKEAFRAPVGTRERTIFAAQDSLEPCRLFAAPWRPAACSSNPCRGSSEKRHVCPGCFSGIPSA